VTSQTFAFAHSTDTRILLQWAVLHGLVCTVARVCAMPGPVSLRPLFLLHCVFMPRSMPR
jgi:hypothetical protein